MPYLRYVEHSARSSCRCPRVAEPNMATAAAAAAAAAAASGLSSEQRKLRAAFYGRALVCLLARSLASSPFGQTSLFNYTNPRPDPLFAANGSHLQSAKLATLATGAEWRESVGQKSRPSTATAPLCGSTGSVCARSARMELRVAARNRQ